MRQAVSCLKLKPLTPDPSQKCLCALGSGCFQGRSRTAPERDVRRRGGAELTLGTSQGPALVISSPRRTSRASVAEIPDIPEAGRSGGGLASRAPVRRVCCPVSRGDVASEHLSALTARPLRPGGSPARPPGTGGAGVCGAAGGAAG